MRKWFTCNLCLRVMEDPCGGPCGHSHCRKCLQHWLQRANDCPTCNALIVTPIEQHPGMADAIKSVLQRFALTAEEYDLAPMSYIPLSTAKLDRDSGKWIFDFYPNAPDIYIGDTGRIYKI